MSLATRRGFLRKTLGTAWTAGALLDQSVFRAAAARGQSQTAASNLFDIQKAAGGVFVALARPATFTNCNAVIFENSNDLLVVDTHSKPSAAAALVAQLRREVTRKPVAYLVNSHFHWDHSQGNPAYRKEYPSADIIAHAATRRILAEEGEKRMRDSLESARAALETRRKALSEAKTPAENSRLAGEVRDTESFLREMESYKPELPNLTVSGDLAIHDRNHDLHIVFRGRGHTEGDVCVFCPQKRFLATGDLAQGGLPFMGDGYPVEWPQTLTAIGRLEWDLFAGGHAGVMKGRERLEHLRGYIAELAERVGAARRSGRSLDAVQKELRPDALASLTPAYRSALVDLFRRDGDAKQGELALASAIAANVSQVWGRFERT